MKWDSYQHNNNNVPLTGALIHTTLPLRAEVMEAVSLPVIVGSGVNEDNLSAYEDVDAIIVGSSLKVTISLIILFLSVCLPSPIGDITIVDISTMILSSLSSPSPLSISFLSFLPLSFLSSLHLFPIFSIISSLSSPFYSYLSSPIYPSLSFPFLSFLYPFLSFLHLFPLLSNPIFPLLSNPIFPLLSTPASITLVIRLNLIFLYHIIFLHTHICILIIYLY